MIEGWNTYLIVGVPLTYIGWRAWRFRKVRKQVSELGKDELLIIDVRSPGEFQSGANPNSINIPLDQLQGKIATLDRKRTIVLCCASGARSGVAATLFKRAGFEKVVNAGPWRNTFI